jgi:hypothetical protein
VEVRVDFWFECAFFEFVPDFGFHIKFEFFLDVFLVEDASVVDVLQVIMFFVDDLLWESVYSYLILLLDGVCVLILDFFAQEFSLLVGGQAADELETRFDELVFGERDIELFEFLEERQ